MVKILHLESRRRLIDDQLQIVCNSLGVSLERQYLENGHDFDLNIRLPELPKPYGLGIHIGDDYLSWRLELTLDHYSGFILDKMQSTFEERKHMFFSFERLAKERNNKLSVQLNGVPIEQAETSTWREFNLVVSKSYSTQDTEFSSLAACLLDFFCLFLLLLVDETEWKSSQVESEPLGRYEGELSKVQVNKYERNRYNRALCLAYYGFECRGCGSIMEEIYGPLGINVIHVHHIVPVSQMGSSYRLDPIKDLIPLCPNCHTIVHKENPPISISGLREILGKKN
jgi:5-methylcytosine-specific restriction enzyme A